jgi:hypothetical protein
MPGFPTRDVGTPKSRGKARRYNCGIYDLEVTGRSGKDAEIDGKCSQWVPTVQRSR